MKTLTLVRHAKSSWGDPALADRDRPLNERGLRDVATMGKRLAQRGVKPDALLASPATRTLTTAEHLAKALGLRHKDIVVNDRLYAASASELLGVIASESDRLGTIVNDMRVDECRLKHGDRIQIGQAEIRVSEGASHSVSGASDFRQMNALLAGLRGQANALVLNTDLLGEVAICQLDGSLTATAYALLSDLVTIARRHRAPREAPPRRIP